MTDRLESIFKRVALVMITDAFMECIEKKAIKYTGLFVIETLIFINSQWFGLMNC